MCLSFPSSHRIASSIALCSAINRANDKNCCAGCYGTREMKIPLLRQSMSMNRDSDASNIHTFINNNIVWGNK